MGVRSSFLPVRTARASGPHCLLEAPTRRTDNVSRGGLRTHAETAAIARGLTNYGQKEGAQSPVFKYLARGSKR